MSRFVLIMGGNGSGKSSVMRGIIGDDFEVKSHPFGPHTVSSSRKLVALGKYGNACGDCDTIKSTFLVYNLADYLSKTYPDYDVYMEGILISGIFKNVAKLLLEMRFSHNRNVSVYLLYTNAYTSVSRVLQRNGGKKINQKGVADKVEQTQKCFVKHRELGLYKCTALDSTVLSPAEIASEILQNSEG